MIMLKSKNTFVKVRIYFHDQNAKFWIHRRNILKMSYFTRLFFYIKNMRLNSKKCFEGILVYLMPKISEKIIELSASTDLEY